MLMTRKRTKSPRTGEPDVETTNDTTDTTDSTKAELKTIFSSPKPTKQLLAVIAAFLVIVLGGFSYSSQPAADTAENLADVEWNWHHYYSPNNAKNTTTGQRRVLIAQYTGLDAAYFEFTDITEKGNRAYAKKWNHDYLRMNGVAYHSGRYGFKGDATYNKVAVLKKAMDAGFHDAVFILDSDAVIFDLDQDALEYLPESKLFAAHRVDSKDPPHTHNINIGVTMWNLRHEKMHQLWNQWHAAITKRRKWRRVPDDQCELQYILQHEYSEEERSEMMNSLNSFQLAGKFVRHSMRSAGNNTHWVSPKADFENRKKYLTNWVKESCEKWKGACDNL